MNQTIQEMKPNTATPVGTLYEILPDGRWAFFFDHHQISGFRKCEQYFLYQHIAHLRPKGVINLKTLIGQWWARTMELYYTSLVNKELTKALACEIALAAWDECKIDDGKPLYPSTYEKFGGREGAVAMIAQYFDFSYGFDNSNWKIVSIEAGFGRHREVKIGENSKVVVYYMGKPDLLIIEDGRLQPLDHKTKDYISPKHTQEFKPHAQTAGYIVAAQVLADQLKLGTTIDRCLINLAARNEPSDNPRDGKRKPRFQRVPVTYSREELLEWRVKTVQSAERLRWCIEHNEWLWNDNACHMYAGCEYRKIDSYPAAARPVMIRAHFNVVPAWNPYLTEDED